MCVKCGFESGVAMRKILHFNVKSGLDIRIINSYNSEGSKFERKKDDEYTD